MTATPGVLHLIPITLGDDQNALTMLPASTLATVVVLDYFVVENEKSARRFLKSAAHPRPMRELDIERFNKDDNEARAAQLLQPVLQGRSAGVLSEAGCPAIADPGALLVAAAHRCHIRVVPHVGPASLLLALMASGFNGQQFAFHGYLPVPRDQCGKALQALEDASRANDVSQIFIETPYRNDAMLATLLEICRPETRLCVASDLTLATEAVHSMAISEWKSTNHVVGRRPSVFVLYAR